MKITKLFISLYILIFANFGIFTTYVNAELEFGYILKTDVVYGQGIIATDGKVVTRDLFVDVYQPSDSSFSKPRPVVILVHGGAFHRGGPRYPPLEA